MAHRKSVQFENLVNAAKARLERVEDFEAKVPDANEPGRGMMWKAVHEFQAEMKKMDQAMQKIESETGPTMAKLKQDNPGHHHVELNDAKEAEKYMLTATVRMNECSTY